MFDGIEVRSKREGTINNELFTLYRDKRQAILTSKKYKGLQALDKTMFSPYPDLELLNQQLDKFKNESKIRDSILLKIKTDFITEHKDNMVSPFILLYEDYRFDDIYSTEQIVSFFNIFNKNLKNNRYYKATEKYAIANKNTSIGVVLNNFSLKNRNNKDVSLSSLKGKYVLIDFWAYWCKPCIASFPHLEKLLKKYKKENFEILGISSDPNNEKWIKALNQHKPSWIQVIDSKDKEVSKQFNVAKLPTTFLIDKENKVIAIDLYGDELDRELEVIFGY